jgi:hypothetical protein
MKGKDFILDHRESIVLLVSNGFSHQSVVGISG